MTQLSEDASKTQGHDDIYCFIFISFVYLKVCKRSSVTLKSSQPSATKDTNYNQVTTEGNYKQRKIFSCECNDTENSIEAKAKSQATDFKKLSN